MINKRIVINDYSCEANGGTYYRIAINTPQGTMFGSIVVARTIIHACAVVTGYLNMFEDIEVHPASIDDWTILETAFRMGKG